MTSRRARKKTISGTIWLLADDALDSVIFNSIWVYSPSRSHLDSKAGQNEQTSEIWPWNMTF